MKKSVVILCFLLLLPGVMLGVQGLKKTDEPMTTEKAVAKLIKADKARPPAAGANAYFLEYRALKAILDSKEGPALFLKVFNEGTPAGKFYALIGLKLLKDVNFDKCSKQYFMKKTKLILCRNSRENKLVVDDFFDEYFMLYKNAYENK